MSAVCFFGSGRLLVANVGAMLSDSFCCCCCCRCRCHCCCSCRCLLNFFRCNSSIALEVQPCAVPVPPALPEAGFDGLGVWFALDILPPQKLSGGPLIRQGYPHSRAESQARERSTIHATVFRSFAMSCASSFTLTGTNLYLAGS